jgi:hypothetical protein
LLSIESMISARSARSSWTKASRTGPGRDSGWPPSQSPAISATSTQTMVRRPRLRIEERLVAVA